MKVANLVDGAGRTLTLGKHIRTGGEGSVYEVAGCAGLVAKVYHNSPDANHGEKLRVMATLGTEKLRRIAAWPTGVLSETVGGSVVGLMMKKVQDFKELHTLYSPAQRKVTFPGADWKFLTHVAANCAAAFDVAHDHGVVIGDVSPANILGNKEGFVNFIDCDSFQIQASGRTFPCKVGTALFTPPELMGRSFGGLVRTVNHDRFGLAVVVFHLLMMGRHPFSGRYGGSGDMPIEHAIEEFRFAYGHMASSVQMQPPLHALTLSALSPQLGTLFEKAFSRQSPTGERPTPADWHQSLTVFQGTLRQCSRDPGHQSPSHLSGCVWCELMKQGAPNFFVSVAFSATGTTKPTQAFILAPVWARIEAVPRPIFAYSRPARLGHRVPTPWPVTVPTVVPPKPTAPAILTASHVPPRPVLPPARYTKCELPFSQSQRVAGYVMVGLAASTLPCCLLGGPLLGHLLSLGRKQSVWLTLGMELLMLITAGVWWLALEWGRRKRQAEKNQSYHTELRERQNDAREQRDAWQRKLNAAISDAERRYRGDLQAWQQGINVIRQEAERRRTLARTATQAVASAEAAWINIATQLCAEFDRKKGDLATLRVAYNDLDRQFAFDQQQLLARAQEFQRSEFLQKQFIEYANIPDIGPTRKATLASNMIECADDVNESAIRQIPGFGAKLTARLLRWRAEVELQFRFNPAIGVPEHERRAIEFKYVQLRQPIEIRLSDGSQEMNHILQRGRTEFQTFKQTMEKLIESMEQTSCDLTVIPSGL